MQLDLLAKGHQQCTRVRVRWLTNTNASIGPVNQSAFLSQLEKNVPHRPPAGAKAGSQFLFPQGSVRAVLVGKDLVPKLVGDLVAKGF